tara:strand:+ start:11708 stop:14116 length:2409 start_codon:yes stop_codon:yes gene_type:complete
MTERITFVEIDLNRCSETYGVAPCTASGPATDKCFNCFATCQDKDNYNKEIVTARHSTVSSVLPLGIQAIPDIASVSINPAVLDLGESIGVRASVSITFGDARYPDTGPEGDRYLSDRDYNPYTQGSYWGKFRARYPFTQGSDIRVIRGSSDQSLEQMETRHFIVENVSGPNSSGAFSIVCKDALKLADSKRAQCPVLSQGELAADITNSAASFTLSPSLIGADYDASGFINIGGEEICSYTRSGDVMTIVRGQFNTDAIAHEAGARVQLCKEFAAGSSLRATDIINDLLVNFAAVPQEWIPIAAWNAEDDTYIQRTYSALIAEPESVTSLVNEVLQQTASTVWWNDSAKQLEFRVLKDVSTDAATYSDDLILADTFAATDQNKKRVSQVWTYFGQINPLEKLDEGKNYSRTQANISSESEINFEGVPSIRRIYSRWITANSRATAENLNLTILSRYSTPPRKISWKLQRNDQLTIPQLAGGYNVINRSMQDAKGAASIVPVQVTQVMSTDTGFSVVGEEVLYSQTITPTDPDQKSVSLETNGQTNVNLYDEAIASSNAAPQAGDTWTFTIASSTVIGSNSTSMASIDTGTGWPAGVTLVLVNFGSVMGKGGSGGSGGSAIFGATDGGAGGAGGLAFEINYQMSIINNNIIGGGGGGGGGGGAASRASISGNITYNAGGGGGGGGQGYDVSLGGPRTNPSSDFTDSSRIERAGTSGNGGGSTANGTKGLRGVVNSGFKGGNGANGAGLGQSGTSGLNGVATSISGGVSSAGGTGGPAGAAINKNGYTVTITNNGAILGAINA